MSYLAVVNAIRDLSGQINPSGTFVHGRNWDASLEFNSPDCQIYLYPITATVDVANNYAENWQIAMGFYFQDEPDSTNEHRELLIASGFDLVQSFLDTINQDNNFQISNIRIEPSYRQMAGTYTGVILNFVMLTITNLCES